MRRGQLDDRLAHDHRFDRRHGAPVLLSDAHNELAVHIMKAELGGTDLGVSA